MYVIFVSGWHLVGVPLSYRPFLFPHRSAETDLGRSVFGACSQVFTIDSNVLTLAHSLIRHISMAINTKSVDMLVYINFCWYLFSFRLSPLFSLSLLYQPNPIEPHAHTDTRTLIRPSVSVRSVFVAHRLDLRAEMSFYLFLSPCVFQQAKYGIMINTNNESNEMKTIKTKKKTANNSTSVWVPSDFNAPSSNWPDDEMCLWSAAFESRTDE